MKIAIIGHGNMGRMVELEAKKLSIPISRIINSFDDMLMANFKRDEIAIDFTEPSCFMQNLSILSSRGISIVCGTTGWHDKIQQVKHIIQKNNIGFIYSSNFSLGVNIFWHIIDKASKMMNKFEEYDVIVHEMHHNKKKDSPSGTALTTSNIVIKNIDRKNEIFLSEFRRQIKPWELYLSHSRCGSIIGNHEVFFDSEVDSISISHKSKGRSSYAIGAIRCAHWIKNKKGFYNIKDYMENILYE